MKTLIRFGLLALCLGFVIDSASAQPPRGGRGGQQPGGRQGGGFGGMQTNNSANLLRSKTVQDALNMTEEQIDKVQEWGKDFAATTQEKMREMMKDVPRDEMREKFAEFQAEMAKATNKGLSTILNDKQMARLQEINMQLQGMAALNDPKVQDDLKLTAEQKEQLTEVMTVSQSEQRELMQELGLGRGGERPDADKMADYRKKFESLRKSAEKKMNTILTPEQKTAWEKATGDKIDLEKVRSEITPQRRPRNDR